MIAISLEHKKVLLTGASRGIGKCIKSTLVQCGAQMIAPCRDELDLSSEDSIVRYLDTLKDEDFDVFIHCAGINKLAGINEITSEIMNSVYQVNTIAPTLLLKHIVPKMQKNQWGRIVFVSSLYSIVSKEKRIAYSASKNALTGLCKSLAIELGRDNILVNCVAPGYVMTEMTKKNLSHREICEIQDEIPTGRFQSSEDVANLVAFLTSQLNNSITGQLIAVDGGFLCL